MRWNTVHCQTKKALKKITWLYETSSETTLANELNTLDYDKKHFSCFVYLRFTHKYLSAYHYL